ncbi:RNA polymerase sigma-70 factor [Sinomicrobium sp.]
MNISETNDLLYKVSKGDRKAFETLYHLYANNLYVIAKSYCKDNYVAEEIVQGVFVNLWDKRKKLNIERNVGGYLYQMVKNRCMDVLRKPLKVISIEDEDKLKEQYISIKALQDERASELLEEELKKRISDAVALLPKTCKKVFVKTKLEGRNYKQTAEELNISVKTVESHMTKALKHMRLHLREFLSCLL